MIDWRRVIEWPWFAYHVLTWTGLVLLGCLMFGTPPYWHVVIVALIGGYAWEVYERWVEHHHGIEPEHPLNRWVVDPLCDLAGASLGWVLVHFIMRCG